MWGCLKPELQVAAMEVLLFVFLMLLFCHFLFVYFNDKLLTNFKADLI